MHKYTFFLVLFAAFVAQGFSAEYQAGQLYVRLNNSFDTPVAYSAPPGAKTFFDEFTAEFGIYRITAPFFMLKGDIKNTYRISFSEQLRCDELIQQLEESGRVVYAEKIPLAVKHDFPNDLGPNTSGNNGQYYLHRIKAPQAWDISTGSSDIVIAVVDDACQTDHPELAGQIGGSYNAIEMSTNVEPPTDAWDHGTFIAGQISARTDNNLGMASLGRNLSLYPIKITDNFNPNVPLAGYEGLAWAIEAGVHVVNMSWGEFVPSQTGLATVISAYEAGIVLVASAGNDNSSNTVYPAAYPHVISVAATTANDTKASFSGFGTWIDIAAPGHQIWSLSPESGYTVKSGTSFAAPLVAAAAGLMLSVNPGLTVDQVTDCLLSSADNIDLFNPNYAGLLGTGRLNVLSALQCVQAQNLNYDAWLTSVLSPLVSTCNPYPDQQIRVLNNGTDTIFSLEIQWQLDSDFPQPFGWNDTLAPGDAVVIDLPQLEAEIGSHTLRINVLSTINQNETDLYMANNQLVYSFEVLNPTGIQLPYYENFESGGFSAGGWTNINPDSDFGWEIATTAGTVPGSKSARLPYYIDFETGSKDYLVSPSFDFSADSSITLSFEYAYQQRTPGLSDTLTISASSDCGQNWIPLSSFWENGSNSFATSPLSGVFFLPVLPDQWCVSSGLNDCIQLDVSAFSGMTGVRFRFEGHNSGGNNIYIDNISLISETVQDTPVAGFTADGSLSICMGDVVRFHSTSLNRPDTTLWFFEGSAIDSVFTESPQVQYNTAGSFDVMLVVWNQSGIDTLLLEDYITVLAPPDVSAGIDPDSVCQGGSATITAQGADLYYWPAAPSLPAVFAQEVSVSPSNTAVFQVIGYSNGCTDTSSASLNIVAPPPSPSITSQDTILISSPAEQYQWFVNGLLIEGATSQLHVPQVNGNYNVRVFNSFGCSSVSSPVNINWVGLQTVHKNLLLLYPNPTETGISTIESPCSFESLKVYNSAGMLVKNWSEQIARNMLIDLSGLSKGLYLIEANTCGQTYFLKWLWQD